MDAGLGAVLEQEDRGPSIDLLPQVVPPVDVRVSLALSSRNVTELCHSVPAVAEFLNTTKHVGDDAATR